MMKKIALISFSVVALIVGALYLAVQESPDRAYERIQRYAAEGDWDKFYRNLSSRTRSDLAILQTHVAAHAAALGIDKSEVLSLKESFIRAVPKNQKLISFFVVESPLIDSVHRNGDEATLSVRGQFNSTARDVRLVKESGFWTLDVDLN